MDYIIVHLQINLAAELLKLRQTRWMTKLILLGQRFPQEKLTVDTAGKLYQLTWALLFNVNYSGWIKLGE